MRGGGTTTSAPVLFSKSRDPEETPRFLSLVCGEEDGAKLSQTCSLLLPIPSRYRCSLRLFELVSNPYLSQKLGLLFSFASAYAYQLNHSVPCTREHTSSQLLGKRQLTITSVIPISNLLSACVPSLFHFCPTVSLKIIKLADTHPKAWVVLVLRFVSASLLSESWPSRATQFSITNFLLAHWPLFVSFRLLSFNSLSIIHPTCSSPVQRRARVVDDEQLNYLPHQSAREPSPPSQSSSAVDLAIFASSHVLPTERTQSSLLAAAANYFSFRDPISSARYTPVTAITDL